MVSRRDFIEKTLKSGIFLIAPKGIARFLTNNEINAIRKEDTLLRFAVCSDGHYGQADVDYNFYHDNMIRWINKENEQQKLDFTVINGDLIHNDPKFLPEAKKKWDNLKMPYYVSHGNHDMVTPEVWEKAWGMPCSHSFEKGDVGFVIVDTADDKGKYICPPDMERLKRQLQGYKNKKHVFIFMHIPAKKEWSEHALDCPDVMKIFSAQENLKAVYHGHDHSLDRHYEHEGKNYFFDSHVGGNWGTPYKGYRITEILKNGDILTYQMNPEITKKVNQYSIANI